MAGRTVAAAVEKHVVNAGRLHPNLRRGVERNADRRFRRSEELPHAERERGAAAFSVQRKGAIGGGVFELFAYAAVKPRSSQVSRLTRRSRLAVGTSVEVLK